MATEPTTPNPPDGAILAAIDALRADLTGQITKLRVDLSDRLDAQGNRLTSIQEEIGVALAGTDHGVQLNKNTREEHLALTEQVSALTRLVRTLGIRLDAIEDKPSASEG